MIEFIKNNQKNITMGGAIALLVICFFQQKELAKLRAEPKIEVYTGGDIQRGKTIDSLMNVLDSVRAENLPLQVENGRYYMALELLREEDKKAADLFQSILETQTE